MKLGKTHMLFWICIILVAVLALGKMYTNSKTDGVYNAGVTEADAAKALALLYYEEQECNEEQADYFKSGDNKKWYEKYVNILLEKKPELKFFKANHKKMESSLTYGELKEICSGLNADIGNAEIKMTHGEDDSVTMEEWYEIYSILVDGSSAESLPEKCELTFVYCDDAAVTDRGTFEYNGCDISDYRDMRAEAYIRGNVLIAAGKIKEDTVVYSNVWIEKTDGENIDTYFCGRTRKFKVSGLKQNAENAVADITVKNHKVTAVAIKSDRINGKVLELTDEEVEIEGFGKLKLAGGFKVYKNIAGDSEGIKETDKSNILVGYDVQSFVVAEGEVCAAVIEKEIEADSIRVLITDTGFKSKFHKNVAFTCTTDFTLEYGDISEKKAAGEIINVEGQSAYTAAGRLKIVPAENGKICLESVTRGYGNPQYRGTMEIASSDEGFIIVNELSLEQYLYAVVPSEMPVSYGVDALKVQAVCARSYAYRHLLSNSCSSYGAHVDDSTAYQVYNNTQETPESIEAVDSTYGEVIMNGGEVISAYFFSTSCGCTTTSEIWGGEALPYIKSRALNASGEIADLRDEDTFDAFIRSNFDSYDSDFPWYRWNLTMPVKSIENAVNSQLASLYEASPECVLTLDENGKYKSVPVQTVGNIQKVVTGARLQGGVLNELIIYGDKATVKILRELNIRKILKPYGNNINKKDGSVNNQMSMLPSAYFVLDEIVENDIVTGYTFVGGGYGHGAGMSQNAVKNMVQTMSCYEILKYFYADVEIEGIYQNQ